jgi:hypothetical protein
MIKLSEMAYDARACNAKRWQWPKWASLCLMRNLGLPTLDAGLLEPDDDPNGVGDIARALGVDRVTLRSDGGRETGQYPRGGNTLPIDAAIKQAGEWLDIDRAVIVMQPTCRWDNHGAVCARIAPNGAVCAEGLGPGYDVGDLTRGGIPAQWRAQWQPPGWAPPRPTTWLDPTPESERRGMRLGVVAEHLGPVSSAIDYLREQGHIALWGDQSPVLPPSQRRNDAPA